MISMTDIINTAAFRIFEYFFSGLESRKSSVSVCKKAEKYLSL